MHAGSLDVPSRHRSLECARPHTASALPRPLRAEIAASESRVLACYTDSAGGEREIVTRVGSLGSILVVDLDLATRADHRLLAHLAADEPPENAELICRDYLNDRYRDPRCCRALTEEDAQTDPLTALAGVVLDRSALAATPTPRDSKGRGYELALVAGRASIPELRWTLRVGTLDAAHTRTLSLREVVANIEHYEPACSLTEAMLALHRGGGGVSTTVLAAELVRVRESPIVLNRRLREAVLTRVQQHGHSMSEIALRCGRIKRDRKGNESGETSWLARRIGLLAEGGRGAPTRWIHSDVLALIAREGLGLSPREVEVA